MSGFSIWIIQMRGNISDLTILPSATHLFEVIDLSDGSLKQFKSLNEAKKAVSNL